MLPMVLAAQTENCTISISWANVAGHGWLGDDLGGNRPSVLKLYQNATLIDTLSPADGHSGTATFSVASGTPLTLVWTEGDFDVENSFSVYAPNGAMIFQCASAVFGDGATVAVIDDPCGTCWPVQGLHVDSLGHDAVRLAWYATADEYQLVLGDFGFSPDYGNVLGVSDTTIVLEDLVPGMRYDAYLYAVCDGEALEPVRLSFTTTGLPVDEFPYYTGFEADEDAGWGVSANINQWTIGDATASEGDFALYVSNDGGQSNNYSDVPTLAYAYRSFVLDEPGLYNFSFDWRAVGDEYSDYLRVFLVPDSLADFESDVFPGTATNYMTFRYNVPTGWYDFNSTTPRHYFNQSTWQTKQASFNITAANAGTYRLTFLWCNNQAQNFPTAAAIDNVSVSRNTCPMPLGLALDAATENTLQLSWTPGGEEAAWQLSVDGGEWVTVDGEPQHTLEGLPAGSTHIIRLRAYCSDEDHSLYTSLTATTTCSDSIRVLPYTDNFEAYAAYVSSSQPGGMNPCWTKGYTGTTGDYPYVSSRDGNHYLYFFGTGLFANSDYHSYVILPPVALDINELELTFDMARNADNHNDTLVVAMASSASADADIDTIAVLTAYSRNFVRQRVRFDNYNGSYRHIALIAPRCYHNESLITNTPCVDNLSLHAIPDCTEPDSLRLVAATETTLSLAWVDAPSARVNYIVEYRQHGESEWMEADNPFSPTSTIEWLDAGTYYDVRVRSYCALGDTSYAVSNTFRTQCAVIDTFPFIEQFSNSDALACWTLVDLDGNGSTWGINASTGALESDYSNVDTTDDWAISPAILIPDDADGYQLNYQVHGTGSYYQMLLSTGGDDLSDFTTVLFDETLSGSYVTRRASLDSYAGQTIRFAIRHHTRGDIGLSIDNFSVRLIQAPTVAISGPDYTGIDSTATFYATLVEGAHEGLSHEWYSTMYDAGLAQMDVNTDNGSMSITYSAAGTDTISLSVVNDHGTSSAQKVVTIYDLQPITAFPYSTGFETSDDRSWQVIGGANTWTIGNATKHGGNASLYVSNDGGATAGYNVNNASVSYAFRSVQLYEADIYHVSFDWKADGEGTPGGDAFDYMRAFIAPATSLYVANILPGGLTATGDFAYETPEAWIDLNDNMPFVGQNSWSTKDTMLTVPSSGLYNIVFLWVNDGADGTGDAAAIDNFSISRISCPAVDNVHLDSVSPSSISLHWTAVGSEGEWIVAANGTSQVVSAPHATIGGLDEATHYTISIRAICSEGDTSAPATVYFASGADCSVRELPWSETFETWGKRYADNYLHPCWDRYFTFGPNFNLDIAINGKGYVCSDTNHSATGALMMYSAGASSSFWPYSFQSVAALPQFSLPANTEGVSVRLNARFFATGYNESGDVIDVDHMEVGYLTVNGYNYSFVPVDTINNTHSQAFVEYTVEMPTYKSTDGRLALRYSYDRDGDFYYVAIDDVSVTALGNPVSPVDPVDPVDPNGIDTSATPFEVTLHPNPATTSATLTTVEAATVTLYDIDGRTHGTWQSNGGCLTLDLNGLNHGTYIVRVVSAHGTTALKLAVQ